MCGGVGTFREQGQPGKGLWTMRLTGDVDYKSFLNVVLRILGFIL